MRKKQELPRKRRRFIRKVIFLCTILFGFVVILFCVAAYFVILKLQKPLFVSPLPKIQAVQAAQDERVEELLQKYLRKAQVDYKDISRNNDTYVVTLGDGGKVTFSSEKDIMTQIASLQYILSHLTMEGRQFSSLDLRFDKPVVVLKP